MALENLSIRYKLIVLILLSSVMALTLAILTLLIYELTISRQHHKDSLISLARTLEVSLHAAVNFDDKLTAEETLATLVGQDQILSAHVFENDGRTFASYWSSRDKQRATPEFKPPGAYFQGNQLEIYHPLKFHEEQVGMLYLHAELPDIYHGVQRFSKIFAVVFITLIGGAYLLSDTLQRFVSKPILDLESVARRVGDTKDYSLRVPTARVDEIGRLSNSFNDMLSIIEAHEKTLEKELKDRQQAEQALAENEERFRTLFEYAPDAILMLDIQSRRFVEANQNALQLFGYSKSELFHMGPQQLSPASQPDGTSSKEAGERRIKEALEGITAPFEWTHNSSTGREISCEVRLAKIPGKSSMLRVSIIDVTKRKMLEEELRQAQKMEAFGLLAGGVAHDFNNLLTAIMGYADMALRQEDAEYFRRAMKNIHAAGGRAAGLTSQLLAFSRKQVLEMRPLNLGKEVQDLSELLRRLIGENIELETSIEPGLSPVRGDSSQLQQVLLNLVVNARDALPRGGKIVVSAGNVLIGRDQTDLHPDAPRSGEYVRLQVSDNGLGMTDEIRRRIFEPFFTTKEVGKGSGLGLSTVYGIVRQHSGHISVESELGRGTTFKVLLPKAAEAPQSQKSAEASAIGGNETVLLVEDEEAVRDLARQILSTHGYSVIISADARQAITIAESEGEKIDLLLTDVIMPEMNGVELYQSIMSFLPGIRVLFMSGYTDDVIAESGISSQGLRLIQKPFSVNALLSKVREALDSSPAGVRSKASAGA